MAMTPYSGETEIIGKLGTTPQERGLTTQQFKDKFDEGLKAFVEWFNLTHKTEFEAVQTGIATHKADNVNLKEVHGLRIESGSFNPYVYGSTTAGTNTYSVRVGSYYKIGKMAFVQGYITMTAKDAAMAGNVLIGGLPYVAATGKTASLSIGEYRYITRAADKQLTVRISGGSNFIELRLGGVNTSEGLPVSAINDNTTIVFAGAYETA